MSLQGSIAVRALTGIPVDTAATFGAAPPLLLFFNPGINTDLLLASDIVQDLTVVAEAIVIKIDDLLTGKIGALRAVSQPFLQGACPQVALSAHDSSYV